MISVGCTGHQGLNPTTRRLVAAAIANFLASKADDGLLGITSLAEGADQLFAHAILAAGGDLHAIVPSDRYESTFQTGRAMASYVALLSLAENQTVLPFPMPSEDAFLAAGHEVADRSDVLIAVWDGDEAVGRGGTGDVVAYARERGVDVHVVWPPGSRRT